MCFRIWGNVFNEIYFEGFFFKPETSSRNLGETKLVWVRPERRTDGSAVMAESPASEIDLRTKRRDSKETPPDLRLVLVGKTGSGKSSSGNTILGSDVFSADVSHLSVTRQCCKHKREVFDRKVTIVDTPGLFDTSLSEDTVEREISKCINMSAPGPHAILLVIKIGPFTADERDTVKKVEEMFGEDAWPYTIILFTHGDGVGSDFDLKLKKAGPELQEILRKVGHRHHVFNNLRMNDRGQVLDLLLKVEEMVATNEGKCYSNYTYQEVVKMLDQREAELKHFYNRKLEEEIKALEAKYEEKLKEAQHQRQEVEERLKSELQELKRYYKVLESGVRHVVEQVPQKDPFDKICLQFPETQRMELTS